MVALSRPASTTSTMCTPLSTLVVPTLSKKCFFGEVLVENITTSRQKCAWPYFHLVTYAGLVWTRITTFRINLLVEAIFLHGERCSMDRVYCLNYFWTNGKCNWKTHFYTVLQHTIPFNKRIWIIRCFLTRRQLSKCTIWDMPFKTKMISLVIREGLLTLLR